MMRIDEVIDRLARLAAVCREGEVGYALAAEASSQAENKVLLARYSRQHARLGGELEQWVERLGGTKFGPTSTHGWTTDFDGCQESALLVECERHEREVREAYDDALGDDLPLNIKMVVQRQYTEIKAAQEVLRRLELASHYH